MEFEDIYENIERRDEDVYANEDALGPGKLSQRQTEPKAPNHRGSRCFVLSSVCLGLICVLLVVAIIVQQIKITAEREIKRNYKNIVEEFNEKINRLQVNYSNLIVEKDQLQSSFNSLNQKNLELETSINSLTAEKNQLQRNYDSLNQKKLELESKVSSSCDEHKKKQVCFFISSEEKSWSDSRQYCRDHGGDLVIINTEEKQRYISSLEKGRVWIGLSDIEKEGNMKWVDNSPLTKGFWDTNEPNDDQGNEDCVEVLSSKSSLNNWNDFPCSEKRKWICEN
ncbi:C-type lectin domain family 4 member E-like isoform X8 [Myxocyprinus asiaticus]|uniref:C-type lectin domain family 4 member E-like isoform X8 n=1 Tax=Myxocyprinus asiaticus TaxID=70543 RepID=UPI002221DB70|nr:C-type lectin domain family 4 member E-like isoform X8 [Myxocyprinus asiaticus]